MKQAVLVPERTLSLKILAHKLRRHVPFLYRHLFLELRHFFFPTYCGTSSLNVVYSDGSWLNRKSTHDSLAIEEFLANNLNLLKDRSILHVGIGNGELTQFILSAKPSVLHGLTIIEEEHANAHSFTINYLPGDYKYFLKNKYSLSALDCRSTYNVIIDNDLAGYACCKSHFRDLIAFYYASLSPDGLLITGARGLLYFDNGFGVNSRLRKLYLDPYFEYVLTSDLGCVLLKRS